MMDAFAKDIAFYVQSVFGMTPRAAEAWVMLWKVTRPIRRGAITIKNTDFIEFCKAWKVWSEI
jgi:hypothetical protein